MIRIETSKVIQFVLFIVVIAAFIFLPYFSQVELPAAQVSTFGLEIVRTPGGWLGLVAAVPLTMAIAAGFALYSHSLGKWEQFLGQDGSGGGHQH